MKKSSPKNTAKGYAALAVTSIVWGTTWVASKKVVSEMPALQAASIRQIIAGLSFLAYFIVRKKFFFPSPQQFAWICLMGLLMFVMANGLSTWSLNYIPTGLSALIGALYPLSVVLIEMIFFKKRIKSPLIFTGLFLGITGIGIVFYENLFHHHSPQFFFGVGLSVVAMLSWSTGTIIISKNKLQMDPYYSIGWQMLAGGLMLSIFAKFTVQTVAISHIPLKAWLFIIYLIAAGSIIAFIAFIFSIKNLSTGIASLYAYINPIVAMLMAPLFVEGEKLTLYILWGAIVTLTGVFLVNYSMKKSKKEIIVEPEQ